MNALMIVVKLNSVARHNNEFTGPTAIETQTDFKAIIQQQFDTVLKGIAGYVLVFFGEKMYQCERDNRNPDGPYVRHAVKWHPLAEKFMPVEVKAVEPAAVKAVEQEKETNEGNPS